MARAHAASACVQSDSIKGLAQSIAKPAYHRLLVAEPALRRAVPTLIIAFLITICLGAFVQVIDQNRQKRASVKRDLAAIADLLASVSTASLGSTGTRGNIRACTFAARPYSIGRRCRQAIIVTGADQRILAHMIMRLAIPPAFSTSSAQRCH
jgi:two-component system cell cycle sensor histidine kinase PleC